MSGADAHGARLALADLTALADTLGDDARALSSTLSVLGEWVARALHDADRLARAHAAADALAHETGADLTWGADRLASAMRDALQGVRIALLDVRDAASDAADEPLGRLTLTARAAADAADALALAASDALA